MTGAALRTMSANEDPGLARILVVDDRPANVVALVEILKDLGQEVVTASSGGEALRILMHQDFAVILLDVHMPGMDGFEVARLLRGRERSLHTPIIFVTAMSVGDESIAQGYSLGAVDYIFTPVVPAILRSKVAVFVDLHDKSRQLEATAERLQASLEEKETLLKEIHHRVKNNLQVIASLLNLQSRHLADERSRALLEESQNRVSAIALVHEMLYQAGDLARIDFGDYLQLLTAQLLRGWSSPASGVQVAVDAKGLQLPVDLAIPCGLIVNELVTNALKHAFPGGRRGTISIRAHRTGAGRVSLRVKDDGVGLGEKVDLRAAGTLGFELVTTLSRQIRATVEVRPQPGSTFELTFEAPK